MSSPRHQVEAAIASSRTNDRSPKEVLLAILANARMAERAMNAKGGREHDEYYIGMATGMRQIITLIETEAADMVKP